MLKQIALDGRPRVDIIIIGFENGVRAPIKDNATKIKDHIAHAISLQAIDRTLKLPHGVMHC